jgi:hypothetical protein
MASKAITKSPASGGVRLTFEIRINGSLQVELHPETPIEKLVLEEMASGAMRGKSVTMSVAEDGKYLVGVER